ncbi:MAG: phage tail protein [Pseudomonas fluorescens]
MADIYVGLIVLELNGTEYEVKSFEPTTKTNRKGVKTMNRQGRVLGHAKGIEEHELRCTVAIPKSGEPDWKGLLDAKITIEPQDGGGKRESYTGVWLMEMGSKFGTDDEATRDLTLGALNHYVE